MFSDFFLYFFDVGQRTTSGIRSVTSGKTPFRSRSGFFEQHVEEKSSVGNLVPRELDLVPDGPY